MTFVKATNGNNERGEQSSRLQDSNGQARDHGQVDARGSRIMAADSGGVVRLPDSAALHDISVEGRDLIVRLADGDIIVIPDGAVVWPFILVDGVVVPPVDLAAYLENIEPAAGPRLPASSGGNFAVSPGEIQAAYDLGDLLPYTELFFNAPTDEEIFAGLLPEEPDDPEPPTVPGNPVEIHGLDVSGGEALLDEDDLADGSSPDPSALTKSGIFTIDSIDGLATVTVGGITIFGEGVTFPVTIIDSSYGLLQITGIETTANAAGKVVFANVSYSYTLQENTLLHGASGQDSIGESFAVVATDVDGSTDTSSLYITIVDDEPIARDDADSLVEDGPISTGGNVISGVGTDSGATGADTPGADGVVVQNAGTYELTYGTLEIGGDGNYTYTLNDLGQALIGTLDDNETLADRFDYTLRDGDGDLSTATLTITLKGLDDDVEITGLNADVNAPEVVLDEDDLANAGDDQGSDQSDPLTVGGNFGVTAPDGLDDVQVNSIAVVVDGVFAGPVEVANDGVYSVTITGWVPIHAVAGDDSTAIVSATFTYSATLLDNSLTHDEAGQDSIVNMLSVTASDTDGDADADVLDVAVVDDVPEARADTGSVTEGATLVSDPVSVLVNDTVGADGLDAIVGVRAAGGDTATDASGGVGTPIVGLYGTLTLNSNGTYTYASDPNVINADAQDVFVYTIRDSDGDLSTTTLTIDIDNVGAEVTDNDVVVNEAGLPDGTGELADGNPANQSDLSEIDADGQIAVTGASGPFTFILESPADGAYGTLALDPVTGAYSYTLDTAFTDTDDAENTTNTVENAESFNYRVEDQFGNVLGTGSIEIDIIDDVPQATDDGVLATVDDNASGVVIGTVADLTGNDLYGADGAGSPAVTIVGTGSLGGTVTIDGGNLVYTSASDITAPYADEVETFTYRITDGDGDTDTATFQVRLTDEGPAIDPVAAAFTVDEDGLDDGLAGGPGDVAGEVTVRTGALTGLAFGVDGAGDIALTAVPDTGLKTLAGDAIATVWDAATHTLTGYDSTAADPASLAADDIYFTLVITDVATGTYTFTLTNPVQHDVANTEDDLALPIGVVVTDAEGESANGTINVTINDDSPILTVPIADGQVANRFDQIPLVGDLNFAPGADGAGGEIAIAADISGLTVGGQTVATFQSGHVLTGFIDNDGSGRPSPGDPEVFAITVDPQAGGSGQYTFDLKVPFDGPTTPVDVAQDGTYGTGPGQSVVIYALSLGEQLALVTGWQPVESSGQLSAAELAAWLSGGEPDLSQTDNVTGSPNGFGVNSITFDAGAFLRFDTGAMDDYDGPGPFDPPGVTDQHRAASLTFSIENADPGETTYFVAHYTNGSTESFTVTGNVSDAPQTLTIHAPADSHIAYVDAYQGTGSVQLGLTEVGLADTTVDIDIPITVRLQDADGDSVSDHFVINLRDNAPDAHDDQMAAAARGEDINAAFVLDFSTSINPDNLNLQLAAVKDTAFEFFSSGGTVSISLVTFTHTARFEGTFTDFAELAAKLDSLNPQLGAPDREYGGTNYSAAIAKVMEVFTPDPNADNRVFFISDGAPVEETGSAGESLSDTVRPLWQAFVDGHELDVTAIGVGNVSLERLHDVDVDGEGTPILVRNFVSLADTLTSFTISPVSGNVLDNDDIGDGGIKLVSIVVDGIIYLYDGSGTITSSSGAVIDATSFTVTTALGGVLQFNFSNGSWTYQPTAISTVGMETFQYVIADSDGDKDSAVLRVDFATVGSLANFARNDFVITNSEVGVSIDVDWLYRNDGSGSILTGVSDATGGTVSSSGQTLLFADDLTPGGSFVYSVWDGTLDDYALVTVNAWQAGSSELWGTSSDDIMIGRPGEYGDTFWGGNGDDIIFGGNGDDFLRGERGSDTLIGGDGDDTLIGDSVIPAIGTWDTLTGGRGADVFFIGDGHSRPYFAGDDLDTILPVDVITDFAIGEDRIQFNDTAIAASPTTGADGIDSQKTINGEYVRSHAIDANGIIRFDDSDNFQDALILTSERDLGAVVDYLKQNDLGSANSLVAFTMGDDSYLYFQTNPTPSGIFDSLVKLEGVTLTALSQLDGQPAPTLAALSNDSGQLGEAQDPAIAAVMGDIFAGAEIDAMIDHFAPDGGPLLPASAAPYHGEGDFLAMSVDPGAFAGGHTMMPAFAGADIIDGAIHA